MQHERNEQETREPVGGFCSYAEEIRAAVDAPTPALTLAEPDEAEHSVAVAVTSARLAGGERDG
jgi:hypothetical protein